LSASRTDDEGPKGVRGELDARFAQSPRWSRYHSQSNQGREGYSVVNDQFTFPLQRTADRYNVALNAMNAAAKRVNKLDVERKKLLNLSKRGGSSSSKANDSNRPADPNGLLDQSNLATSRSSSLTWRAASVASFVRPPCRKFPFLSIWGASAGAVHPANAVATDRRGSAGQAGAL